MTRIACLAASMVLAASLTVASSAEAAGRHEHAHASSGAIRHHTSHSTVAISRPAVVHPVIVGYAPSYSSYSSRQPLTFPRTAAPALVYLPATSPNAPPFSFSGSEENPGWNWRRVRLQQIDAEVRARRAAAGPAVPPAYRQYCPDSRTYYPEVTQCASDWLTVLSKSAAASPVVASR